ncbi:putative cytokinetic ring protein SteA [Brevibacillus sp. SYP-B805]|uniref:putative cytokinetic ring protein SteA n=1 Tax=Brevibacillus sp. SYP-B805 TaxID=1578199 RepID=UPI003216777C
MKRKRTYSDLFVSTVVADRKTKQLCKRIQPNQIALLAHADVDEVAAESLLEARVGAVVNTFPFLTGTYPAEGAKRLLEAGIPLYETVGSGKEQLMDLPDGTTLAVAGEQLLRKTSDGWETVAHLRRVLATDVRAKWQEANRQLDRTLSAFIDNTLLYASWEKDLFLKPLRKLPLATSMANRHVVVVVRGKHYREDLRMLSSYIRDCRPVLIAVDGGADALLENGYRPDMIVGDLDSVSDRALCCGAEIVVHAYPDGRAPGEARVARLGVSYHLLPAPGTSEDVAMLLAYEEQAQLIVTIGTHTNMIDFLEKGRKGMASTLLVRTKIGPKLIDAKGVSQLYQPRLTWNTWAWFVACSLVPILAILAINPVTRHVGQMLWVQWRTFSF